MDCIMCKGDMANGSTTDFTDLGDCMVIIKNVPCLKCTQCGETAYVARVVKQLENIINGVKDSLMEVAIINYPDKVA